MNNEYQAGRLVEFQSTTYRIVKDEGDSLLVKRSGSNTPISIPKNQSRPLLEEGKTPYDSSRSLNG